jgi:hypothetical protein
MFAIISDIHANIEALRAVLADIERQQVDGILCLGDLVGYGPNPVECVELALSWQLVLMGNYELALILDPEAWPRAALASIVWTKTLLASTGQGRELLAFLADRPRSHRDDGTIYVHGSPRDTLHEYLFPEDIYNQRKMDAIAAHFGQRCFCGHTHIPGVFVHHPDNWEYLTPAECNDVYHLDERKTIINVGSVGQPRDNDPRACYVLYDGRTTRFRRIDYDFETTARKIRDLPDLDDFLGDRLRYGR